MAHNRIVVTLILNTDESETRPVVLSAITSAIEQSDGTKDYNIVYSEAIHTGTAI